MSTPGGDGLEGQLLLLRERADEDHLRPSATREPGRHQADLGDLGLRVAITRSRYPNRDDGVDQYAVTLSRVSLDGPPADSEVALVLQAAFGAAAAEAVERTAGGPVVRLFRVPASQAS